jgi:hypothetical protein
VNSLNETNKQTNECI